MNTVYLIRHLRTGVLTDCVYGERPDDAALRAVCGDADVDAGLVRVVEAAFATSRTVDLDAWVAPEPPAPARFEVRISGTGTVT